MFGSTFAVQDAATAKLLVVVTIWFLVDMIGRAFDAYKNLRK